MFQNVVCTNEQSLLTTQHRHIVLCLNDIIHRHLKPRRSLLISLTSASVGHLHLYANSVRTVDVFLRNLSDHIQWSVEVSKPGDTELHTTYEEFHKHDSYIIFTGLHEEESSVLGSITEQVNELYKRMSWNFRARFIFVAEIHVNVPLQQLTIKILEEMWKYYSIMNILLVISVTHFKVNDTKKGRLISHENSSQTDILLYTWFPYTSKTRCDKLHSAVLIDRWTSKGEFVLKANLFPDKVPRTFQGCKSNVNSFLYPPAIMEMSHGEYAGFEINYLTVIFKKINLTAVYNILPYKRISHLEQFLYTIYELEPSSSDIAIGLLPFGVSDISIAESTIPYADVKITWYVPCPKQASRWRSVYEIFSLPVWLCFCFFTMLAIITMWLLAKYARHYHLRESANYMTIIYCIYNLWAIITGVSVPEKPISIGLRIFFITWVWFSVAMTTVYQTFFVGLLVNPGFEKSITTLNELIESKIEYGFTSYLTKAQFSEPIYDTIKKNRKVCGSMFKCLERIIRQNDFATVSNTFHAEYFKARLLFHNIHIPLCTLQDDIVRYSVSTYMAKGNPLLKVFNKMIRYLFEAGLFQKWRNDFMTDVRLGGQPIESDDSDLEGINDNYLNNDYSSYSLSHLQVVFYMLLCGYGFSILTFLGELLYYRTWVIKIPATVRYRPQGNILEWFSSSEKF